MRLVGVGLAMLAACWATPAAAQKFIPIGDASAGPSDRLGVRRPSATELSRATDALRRYFAMPPRTLRARGYWEEASRRAIAPLLGDYIVQVTSVFAQPAKIPAQGERRREILMQGACPAGREYLRNIETDLFLVADGGDCYFYARYDPALDRIVSFYGGGQ